MQPPSHITPPPAAVIRPMQALGNGLVLATLADYAARFGWEDDGLHARRNRPLRPSDLRSLT